MPGHPGIQNLQPIATNVLASLESHEQIPSFAESGSELSLSSAYQVTAMLRAAFEARGETIVGRKVGFTNRDMWQVHGVQSPIWGYCTDRTVFELENTPTQKISNFAEPRIEPEIIFGIGQTPSLRMSNDELLDCIEWLSLGYEMVQSIFPGWKFTAFDTVVANALHGTLLVGKRHPVSPRKDTLLDELSTFTAELHCNGTLNQTGGGDYVLNSPLNALRHLVQLLGDDPHNPPLAAGEIVSTGTLTLAMPVSAGQCWTTKVQGIALEDITLRFEA